MNWEKIQGNWKQISAKAKEHWGKLSDDDLNGVEGKREQLASKIQMRYGVNNEEAQKQVNTWLSQATDAWFLKDGKSLESKPDQKQEQKQETKAPI
jgi:uncharacterized protein YjbJ (UPF0337 family)